ncbi:MAG: dihydroxy-acid dehydratase [Aquisalimonadaceae bacterium]
MSFRSNFRPGCTRWAVRRAQWRALGLSEEDMHKPKIAVVNTSSDLAICYSHLDALAALVKDEIRAAGGLPFEIRTAAPSDFVTGAGRGGRYLMPSRELVVNDIEVMVEGAELDGMICLSSCDKTAPAHLMAAARLNIPSILVIGGYQSCGVFRDAPVDIEDVFEGVGEVMMDRLSLDDLITMTDSAVTGPGVCAGMGTANSMHIAAEALGMTLPGAAPVLGGSERMADNARQAARRIVGLVEEGMTPRKIMTPAAFANAVKVMLAVSGSVNALRHMQAVAREGEVEVDIYDLYDRLGPEIALLCAIKPNGPGRIDQLERAGGARAVMKRLQPLLDLDVTTVTGMTLADVLNETPADIDSDVVASLDSPFAKGPALIILRGNLAPAGAIVKLGSTLAPDILFKGAAKVFESQEAAMAALEANELKPGTAVILRGLGPRGGPGVASASWFVAAVNGAGLGYDMAVITDGQLSGLNRGLTVGQVTPEAAGGGPLALVRDGDPITIDLAGRKLSLGITEQDFRARQAALPPFTPLAKSGWLALYESLVQPLSDGAVLKPGGNRPGEGN